MLWLWPVVTMAFVVSRAPIWPRRPGWVPQGVESSHLPTAPTWPALTPTGTGTSTRGAEEGCRTTRGGRAADGHQTTCAAYSGGLSIYDLICFLLTNKINLYYYKVLWFRGIVTINSSEVPQNYRTGYADWFLWLCSLCQLCWGNSGAPVFGLPFRFGQLGYDQCWNSNSELFSRYCGVD